jgi:hypothetical protein
MSYFAINAQGFSFNQYMSVNCKTLWAWLVILGYVLTIIVIPIACHSLLNLKKVLVSIIQNLKTSTKGVKLHTRKEIQHWSAEFDVHI